MKLIVCFGHGKLIVAFRRSQVVRGRCLLPCLVLPVRLRVFAGVLVGKGQPPGDFVRLQAKPFAATEALQITADGGTADAQRCRDLCLIAPAAATSSADFVGA